MIIFENKIYFWLFWVIPVIILLFALTRLWRKRAQKKFADAALLKTLSPDKSRFKPLLKLVLFCLALACLIMALVNPKIGSKMITVKREGVDIVFAVDVSRSMLAEDVAPNRLEKAKRIAQQIIDHLHGDRIGIIAYAGEAVPQLPITTDYGAAHLFLNKLNTEMLSSQGTAIAQAINLSLEYFNDDSKTSRVLVLLSDGEDHEGQIKEVAKLAAKKHIRIFTIGIGTPKGGRIPIKENGVVQYFLKDKKGETVITRLDESTLKKIAAATDGKFVMGQNTEKTIKQFNTFLNGLQKTAFETKKFASYDSRFQWFLGFGILFIVVSILLMERKTTWLKKLNLFNEKQKNDNG